LIKDLLLQKPSILVSETFLLLQQCLLQVFLFSSALEARDAVEFLAVRNTELVALCALDGHALLIEPRDEAEVELAASLLHFLVEDEALRAPRICAGVEDCFARKEEVVVVLAREPERGLAVRN
jgi:hypothetical protein